MPRSPAPQVGSISIPIFQSLNNPVVIVEETDIVEDDSSHHLDPLLSDKLTKNDNQNSHETEPNILPEFTRRTQNETDLKKTSQEKSILKRPKEMDNIPKIKTSNTFKPHNIPLILEENEETEELHTTLNLPNEQMGPNDTLSSSDVSETQRGTSETSGVTNALENLFNSSSNEISENKKEDSLLSIQNSSPTHSNIPNSLGLPLQISSKEPLEARKSPVTVQEWIDSLPLENNDETEQELPPNATITEESDDHHELCLGAEAGLLPSVTIAPPPIEEITSEPISIIPSCSTNIPIAKLGRESSLQSDVTTDSHCSSVESLLESRRCDPEEILLGLGFGGPNGPEDTPLSRIPRRFWQPSLLKGVGLEDFIKEQEQQAYDPAVWGYRGLTGPGHKPSDIVAKIIEKLRQRETLCSQSVSSLGSVAQSTSISSISAAPGKFSAVARRVLTRTSLFVNKEQQSASVLNNADNRKFVAAQQDGSDGEVTPSRRMILGPRSFTLHGDGEHLELDPTPSSHSHLLRREDSNLSSATSATSLTSFDSGSAGRNENTPPSYNQSESEIKPSNVPRRGSLKRQPCIEESFEEFNNEAPEPFTAILSPPEPPPPPQPPPNILTEPKENNSLECNSNEVSSSISSIKNTPGSDDGPIPKSLNVTPSKEISTCSSDNLESSSSSIISSSAENLSLSKNFDEAFGIKSSSTLVALHENNNFSLDSSCVINQLPINSPNGDEGEITPTLQEDSGLSSPEALERFVEENLASSRKSTQNNFRDSFSSCTACSQRPQLEALRSALRCFSSSIFNSDEASNDSTRILIADELRKAANLLERPGAERAAGRVLEQVSFLLHHQSEISREMASLEETPSNLIVSQSLSPGINTSFSSLRLETRRLAAQVARNTRELSRLRILLSQKPSENNSDSSPELDN